VHVAPNGRLTTVGAVSTWQVGNATITRVPEPGFELVLAQDTATTARLRSQRSWLAPDFVTEATALRVGSSAVVIRSAGTLVLVDPWLAFDGPDRLAPDAVARVDRLLAALGEAGFAPDAVDVVVNTHLDGVGANTRPVAGAETTAFPGARYLLAAEELQALRAGRRPGAEAFETLVAEGSVDLVTPGHRVTDEVHLEAAPGHSAGHLAVVVRSVGAYAVVPGHLFLHPAQVFAPEPRPGLDENPEQAAVTRRAVLERCAAEAGLLVGPLFAEPGAGRVVTNGQTWRLDPP
jgi:glyoxylase-like metal-dependent hydrolase (beta-lactamase superfamily II)